MRVVRFIFPFLFVRNWYNGTWEFSWSRFVLCALTLALLALGILIAYILQSPVVYNASFYEIN